MKGLFRHCLFTVLLLQLHSSITWDETVVTRLYVSNFSGYLTPNQENLSHNGIYYQALELKVPDALVQYYTEQQQHLSSKQRLAWLSQDKLATHWRANWYLGRYWYEQEQLPRARLWMTSAMELYQHNTSRRAGVEYSELLLELVEVLLALKEYSAANKLLNNVALLDDVVVGQLREKAVVLRARGAMLQGQLSQAKRLLDLLLAQFGVDLTMEARILRQHLVGLINDKHRVPNCGVNIQLLASDYHQWLFAHQILVRWQNDKQLSTLPICFKSILSFDPKLLLCQDKAGQRQSCDLRMMAKYLDLPDDVLPVLVHGQFGIANYNNGIIFINRGNSYGVFVHELFHHFGFFDEYALSKQLGDQICNVNRPMNKGENLIVVPADMLLHFKQSAEFKPLYTQVDTCKNFAAVAFKITPELTIMGYMDQKVPAVYVERARDRIINFPHQLSNYHYAYALAFEQVDDVENYRLWLKKSADLGYEVAQRLLVENQ